MRTLVKWLSNIKFSIVILVLLIFCSFIGSIVEQNDKVITLVNKTNDNFFVGFLFGLVNSFNLSNIFNNFWFFLLNFILGLSLVSCTFTQQLPSFDFCRSLNFLKKFVETEKFDGSLIFPSHWFPNIIIKLANENYFIFQKHRSIYGYHGLSGRLGPVFVHLSLILILISSLISSLNGILAQEFIPKSEIIYLQNFPTQHLIENLPLTPIRINDFWVSYIKGSIHQFYSNVSSLSNFGEEKTAFTLSVNHPFFYENVIWYQTDWDVIGLKCKFNDLIYQLPITSISIAGRRLWISWLPFSQLGSTIFLETLRGDFLLQSPDLFSSLHLEISENLLTNSQITASIVDVLSCTGLQVRSDPGETLLSLAFAMLILSTFVSYISYSRIWIVKKTDNIQIGGLTNRAKLRFDYELLKVFNFASLN